MRERESRLRAAHESARVIVTMEAIVTSEANCRAERTYGAMGSVGNLSGGLT